MSLTNRPAWLVRQENGRIAEARTRAFLLDRFWILERSVDVNGADFIIQRRLTTQSLLDQTPPRFGFVQAKYYQDKRTTQYVHREYVLNSLGQPRAEFFVLLHTGVEDRAIAYFLSAAEISERFTLTSETHSKPNRFELPGAKVMIRPHEVLDRARVLNQIEQSLRNADFRNNRRFMSWALPSIDTGGPLREEYLEPIDNWWCNIPQEFDRLREKARNSLWDLQEARDLLHAISTADDPAGALDKAEDFDSAFEGSVSFGRMFDDDLFNAVQHHQKRHDQLREASLLGAHAALRRALKERVVSDIAPKMPLDADCVYIATLQYTPSTLTAGRIESGFGSTDDVTLPTESWGNREEVKMMGVLDHRRDAIQFFLIPGRWGYGPCEGGKNQTWEERFTPCGEYLVREVMAAILAGLFDGDSDSP